VFHDVVVVVVVVVKPMSHEPVDQCWFPAPEAGLCSMVLTPHLCVKHKMQPIVAVVAWYICLSVCWTRA